MRRSRRSASTRATGSCPMASASWKPGSSTSPCGALLDRPNVVETRAAAPSPRCCGGHRRRAPLPVHLQPRARIRGLLDAPRGAGGAAPLRHPARRRGAGAAAGCRRAAARALAPLLSLAQRLPSVVRVPRGRGTRSTAPTRRRSSPTIGAASTSARWATASTARPSWTRRAARGNCGRSSAGLGAGARLQRVPRAGHLRPSRRRLAARP